MVSRICGRISVATLSVVALILVGWPPAVRAQSVPIVSIASGQNADGRLELFVKVCRAVQHAHQKGIIHRDLLPRSRSSCLSVAATRSRRYC